MAGAGYQMWWGGSFFGGVFANSLLNKVNVQTDAGTGKAVLAW